MRNRISLAPIIYVALLMLPVYWLFAMSIKTNAEIMRSFIPYPQSPTMSNYQFILGDQSLVDGYVNAIIYVLMNVVISVAVSIPAAYAFSRLRFSGNRVLFFGFLVFRMMAPAILLVPFVEIFSRLNLIDTHFAVALSHFYFNIPVAVWIFEGFISSIQQT